MEFKELKEKVLKEFDFLGHKKTKLKFSCFDAYDAKIMCYILKEKDGSKHEITIIGEDICYFNKMTISRLLEKPVDFFMHRYFPKGREVMNLVIYRHNDEEETINNPYLVEWIKENYPSMIENGADSLIELDYYDFDNFANWLVYKLK